jgi:hypothetical protein
MQKYEAGRGLRFHFDKDEQLMATERRMAQVSPLLTL